MLLPLSCNALPFPTSGIGVGRCCILPIIPADTALTQINVDKAAARCSVAQGAIRPNAIVEPRLQSRQLTIPRPNVDSPTIDVLPVRRTTDLGVHSRGAIPRIDKDGTSP